MLSPYAEVGVEIEKFFEEFGTTAFWTDYTNVEMMQCIVDTKFSSYPGSEYKVDVQYFNTPRLVICCLMCSGRIELKSYHHFISHHQGKIHMKNCVLSTKSVNEFPPLVRRECLRNVKQFPLGSLERDIADNKTPIVGVSFVFEELVCGCVMYYCDLCKQRHLPHKEMLTHLNSDTHTKCYINVVLHEDSPRSAESMSEKKRQIEKHDGRTHYNICDMNDGQIQQFLCTSSMSSTILAANNKGPTSKTTSKKTVFEGDELDTEDATINILYVAISRISSANSLIFLAPTIKHAIKHVVYTEALQQ
ncbi:hypothetical protein Pcinc_001751 [Petrolisthes cinctipes]|uniref:Uncharacterized protein n=1 Tax=Petrolisthes cinctipes TaxID=88211 RepID=A0AAE1GKP8_PETCI|nr:hypothetical protein Pcinc_001751 [Petrolisthes cinctipes]